MRIRTSVLVLGLTVGVFAAAPAIAAGPQEAAGSMAQHPAPTQQQKMKFCNDAAKAKGLTGSARKDFMSNCLKEDHSEMAGHANSQQQKMQTCNDEAKAKGLTGSARRSFMSTCLKG